jgi:ABC-type multidrug transport system fused ATPase/permease subunit
MGGLLPFDRALIVLLLTPEFFLPLRQLAIRYHAGSAGKAAAERIFAILDTPAVRGWAPPAARPPVPGPPQPRRLDIRFDDVHVAYDGGQRPALNGFTLSIAHGQTVALVGATGAGKTTVANLLLRFVEPVRGRITVGGVDLSEISPTEWRALVAWAPQHPHLFHGTIAENIRLGEPDASPEAVVAAARAAHAHEFIEALPRGYDTPIGERGARLSGGQRQRLALARAFVKDAPLLILDEATSHLDPVSEALIKDALARLIRNRTVLIIAHRLILVDGADAIAVMDGGRVVHMGVPRAPASGNRADQHVLATPEWSA